MQAAETDIALEGGFADVPVQAANAFRVVMQAMARPGHIGRLDGAIPPEPMSVAAGVVALTLFDPETPVFLAPGHDTDAVRRWIAFHTGAPVVAAEQAMFALGRWAALPLAAFSIGTPEYPDRSATLIVEMDTLSNEGATLKGPGLQGSAKLSLPTRDPFRANARNYPLGLDFLFTCADRVAALPRTTEVS